MSTDPQKLLDCARQIRQHLATEAGYRAVISRAYYAAYHAANKFHHDLPSVGRLLSANGLHEQLIERLENPSVPSTDPVHLQSRRIGIVLRDLHRDRVLADYKLERDVEDAEAQNAIATSAKLLSLVVQ